MQAFKYQPCCLKVKCPKYGLYTHTHTHRIHEVLDSSTHFVVLSSVNPHNANTIVCIHY